MADEAPAAAAPTTTEVVPAASADTAPRSPQEAPRAPGIDPSEAGRILARAKQGLGKGKETAPTPKADAVAGTPSGAPKSTATSVTSPGDAPSPEVKAPTEDPKTKPADEAAERLATLVRDSRRLQADQAKLATERKAWDAEQATLKSIRDARASGDELAVLQAVFPEQDLTEAAFWKLLDRIKAKEDPTPFDPATVPELVEAAVKAREEKAAADRQAAARADVSTASSAYAEACVVELKAAPDKFPLVRSHGVSAEQMDAHVRAVYAKTGQVPEANEALAHFEAQFVKRLEGTPYAPKPVVAAPVASKTITSSMASDGGGKTQPEGKVPTLEEKTQAMRERLRALDRQRAEQGRRSGVPVSR